MLLLLSAMLKLLTAKHSQYSFMLQLYAYATVAHGQLFHYTDRSDGQS